MQKSNMMNINFDDGFKEITINNDESRVIRWNPTDPNFVDRYMALQDWGEKELPTLIADLKIGEDGSFDNYSQGGLTKLGELLNDKLDETFNSKVSKAAFMGTNPLTPLGSGQMVFQNLLSALDPLIMDSIDSFEKANKKYVDKAIKHKKSMSNKQ